MTLRLLALASATLLAACAGDQPRQTAQGNARRECLTVPVTVTNAASRAVEQLYIGPAGAMGRDRLAGGEMAPRGTYTLPRPADAPFSLRAVFVTGQDSQIAGLDGCIVTQVEISDTGIRAR